MFRLLLCAAAVAFTALAATGDLKVSPNHRFLMHADGSPFFYLGDTAWELFHRLNRDETLLYLDNRAKNGFTVIQAVALAELDGLNTPNAYGEKPLIDNDPRKPNDAYFKHVDWVVKQADERGLYIGLLPTWGDKLVKEWGKGPVVFNESNARAFGLFIGKRFANQPNIIWILGGDRSPEKVHPDLGRDGGGYQGRRWRQAPDHLSPGGRAFLFGMAAQGTLARLRHDAIGPWRPRSSELRDDREGLRSHTHEADSRRRAPL